MNLLRHQPYMLTRLLLIGLTVTAFGTAPAQRVPDWEIIHDHSS